MLQTIAICATTLSMHRAGIRPDPGANVATATATAATDPTAAARP
jgi:hypothetical protein